MALVVETGLGVADATSYISVADADTHHELYGNEAWLDFSDDEKEILLRRATRDIDILYGSRYDSVVLTSTQALLWPRLEYVNSLGFTVNGLPRGLAAATAELALIEGEENVLDPVSADLNVKSITKQVGSLQKSISYFSPVDPGYKLRRVQLLLTPLIGVLLPTAHSGYVSIHRG